MIASKRLACVPVHFIVVSDIFSLTTVKWTGTRLAKGMKSRGAWGVIERGLNKFLNLNDCGKYSLRYSELMQQGLIQKQIK
jgi:hypothetical protein